jgi:hypothetical protein
LNAVDAIMNRHVIYEHSSEPANDERVKCSILQISIQCQDISKIAG